MDQENEAPSDGLEAAEDVEDDELGDAASGRLGVPGVAIPGEDVARAGGC
jgi:hypothetical protein